MIEGAALIEELEGGEQVSLGKYDFIAMPSYGDRVILSNKIGGLATYEVVSIEHSPIRSDGTRKAEGKLPWCAIYLKMLDPMYDVYLETTGRI